MKKIVLMILMLSVLLAGCKASPSPDSEAGEPGRLKVVTTLFPYYDFVRQIAGDRVDLTMVIPAGMDSHSFEPTPADMITIQEADLLVCNGGTMEHWFDQVLDSVGRTGRDVAVMMDYVDTVEEEHVEGMESEDEEGHDHAGHDYAGHDYAGHDYAGHDHAGHDHADHDHGEHGDHPLDEAFDASNDDGHEAEIEYDEHIWTSPANAIRLVEAISARLQEADPENAELYRNNTAAYISELEALDQELWQVMDQRKRNMIIVGDKFPFRYLADEFGLHYRAAFSGCSTDTEPSAQTIAYLIDKVKEEQIPVIYYLELSSHRVSEIVGEETGARPLLLHSCHNVTRSQFDGGITYLELMKQNAEKLREGLDK